MLNFTESRAGGMQNPPGLSLGKRRLKEKTRMALPDLWFGSITSDTLCINANVVSSVVNSSIQ